MRRGGMQPEDRNRIPFARTFVHNDRPGIQRRWSHFTTLPLRGRRRGTVAALFAPLPGRALWMPALLAGAFVAASAEQPREPDAKRGPKRTDTHSYVVVDGTLRFDFAADVLESIGVGFIPQGDLDATDGVSGVAQALSVTFQVDAASDLEIATERGRFDRIQGGRLRTCGALLLDRPGERVVVGNLALEVDPGGALTIVSTLDSGEPSQQVFELLSVAIQLNPAEKELQLLAEIGISESWADRLGLPEARGLVIGVVTVEAELSSIGQAAAEAGGCAAGGTAGEAGGTASTGPDVLVAELQSTYRFGRLGDITAFAVGTTACNIGTQRANWIASTNQHPVIIQNAYRLDDRGFQQIGMSWVKHGFYAVSQSVCSPCNDPTNGSQLGVGCSDPYSASLNGVQTNMSPRSTVNGHTGYFPYPWSGTVQSTIARRLQVHDADLDPAWNPNARYFVECHYVTADDAAAGNQDNNASYREIYIGNPSASTYYLCTGPSIPNCSIVASYPTRRGKAAVRAWKDADPAVVETDIRVPGEGLFILAADARPTGTGTWRYRYALQNLNSDRSARSLSVQFPLGGTVQNPAFHDVDYHSGEPYAGTDWEAVFDGAYLTWSTDTYEVNANANALRYDAIYSFSFESNVAPGVGKVTLQLFKPGQPTEVAASTLGPLLELIDCQPNGIPDLCDLDCGAAGCSPPCGASIDCNLNSVPDECEADCNHNDVADECDIANCPPGELWCADCNSNSVPDGCEADCDGDGVIDACEVILDTDGDGVTDCDDLCPKTTPVGACLPPYNQPVICCFPSGIFLVNLLTWSQCLTSGGVPVCDDPPMCPGTPCRETLCRAGCLVGDCDGDGDLDGNDFAIFLAAFGCRVGDPKYLWEADIDDDGTVTLVDYQLWLQAYRGFVGNSEASAPQPGVLGDLDADGDLDLRDFADLQSCINGAPETSLSCIVKFDFDGNRRVDLDDFAAFEVVFRGPQR